MFASASSAANKEKRGLDAALVDTASVRDYFWV
jgi:hypothetical protein